MKNENELTLPVVLSIILHLCLFFAASLTFKKQNIIFIPVELAFFQPQGAPQAAQPELHTGFDKSEEEAKKKKDDEIFEHKKKEKDKKKAKKNTKEKKKESVKPQITPMVKPAEETQQANGQGSGGLGVGTQLGPGSTGNISLDSINFPYAYYTNAVVKKIARNWRWAKSFGKVKAVVYFRIEKSGILSELKIKDTSGDKLFDEQALRAIELSGPFPPLPSGYKDDNLGVYFEFAFSE